MNAWRRARLWLAAAAVLVLGALLVATVSQSPSRPLDPGSAQHDGSKALARLLAHYGAAVRAVDSVTGAVADARGAAILVIAPAQYSAAQLRRLSASAALLVLVQPGPKALAAVLPGAELDATGAPDPRPGCADSGAQAAGGLTLPTGGNVYRYPGRCYGGLLVVTPHVAVLGSAQLLRNDHLAGAGVAAVDLDTVTRSRSLRSVVWLLPGRDAAGTGPASVWDLFPTGAHRAFWWLLAVGVLLAIWRARRLGGVVPEPLPVVVRSAEAVEGHGRLYLRAGARDRAAAALRSAAVARLAARLGLPRGSRADEVGVAAAPMVGCPPAQLVELLAGPPPQDDAHLMRLARDLDTLQAEVTGRIGT